MKHPSEQREFLRALLDEAGVFVPADDLEVMVRHVEWLLQTNRQLNLTAVTEPAEALRLHVVDSLLALQEVQSGPAGLLLDIGTGGGFPGLELAVASGREGLLVDSVAKKANALRGFLLHESLEPRISVSARRTEEIASDAGPIAAVVTARAVAELPVLAELAAPLLRLGGILVALKGSLAEDELRRGAVAAERCGLALRGSRSIALPVGGERRTIVVFEKSGKSLVRLPRRPGMANKRPLA